MTAQTLIAKENLVFSVSAVTLIVAIAIWAVRLDTRVEAASVVREEHQKTIEQVMGNQMGFQTVILDKLTGLDRRLSRIEGKLDFRSK